jgi:hypothetical protein
MRKRLADLKPGSRRMAILRDRRRKGIVVAPTPVGLEVIEALIALGWLKANESDDRGEIGEAIGSVLTDMARSLRK